MTAAAQSSSRRVVRISQCCGREVLDHESDEEWAAAEFERHGQPPAEIVDLVGTLARQAGRSP